MVDIPRWIWHIIGIQVVPGRAGGRSFRRKKWYIARKEFAYRMCARRPTSAMPKPFLCCERAFCCSMVVMWPVLMQCWLMWCAPMWFDAMWLLVLCHVTWCNAMSCDVRSRVELSPVVPCNGMEPKMHWLWGHIVCSKWWSKPLFCTTKHYSVLQSTTPLLPCTTQYYSSTTLYYKLLPQYYSVLQSASTTLYYNVLLQYYSVLQGTTAVLLCTAKYYSSTTLYYKVLLQYYSVLQSTTPILLCTTRYYSSTTLYCKVLLQYYSVLQSTTPVLLCTTKYYSSTTLYYTVLQRVTPVLHCTIKQHSWLMSVAYETSFTMRGATGVILQRHEIEHLPRKMTVMIDPRHIWNVIYNERSNRNHNPSSPNTAPATQNECHQWSASHMKRHFQCAEQVKSPFKLTNYCACHANESHDWSASHMKRHLECAEQQESPSTFTKYCACHAKWISWLIRLTYETSFRMRGASKVNLEPHQILRLPRKMHLMIDPRHIWNVI